LGLAPATSASSSESLVSFDVNLPVGGPYVVVVSGVVTPGSFAANPDGKSTGIELLVKDNARQSAQDPQSVDFFALHGSTDAPTVDVIARGVATLVDDASYKAMTGYLSVPPGKYILDVTPGDAPETVVATFEADLSGLAGGAAVVFASGFLNPAANANGPAFGLFAALPSGAVVELPQLTTARLQVIHNAAAPAAASVDIYVNGGKLLNDFRFRKATPFIDAPANTALKIGVAPGGSASADEVIAEFDATLKAGETYVVIANGVLNPNQFAPNPDSRSTAFTLYIHPLAKENSLEPGKTDFYVFHGVTDAPQVDITARNVGLLVDNAGYGDNTGYLTVAPSGYTLDLSPAEAPETVLKSFYGGFWKLGGKTAVVFASGFLNPQANQNGPGFGIFAALTDGKVVSFAELTTARLQLIHNAADPAAAVVDVYVNGNKLLDDFAFRTATPFIDVPAATPLNVAVAPGTSASVAEALATFPITLLGGNTYVGIANGVLNPTHFSANPDGLSIAFMPYAFDEVRESAKWKKYVEFIVFHGATDAPAVDVHVKEAKKNPLIADLKYGAASDYIRVLPDNYVLQITPAGNADLVVASFAADLNGLAGQSAIIVASGFLNPAANANGSAFGLIAVLPSGAVVSLPPAALAKEALADQPSAVVNDYGLSQNYPNPFNPVTSISFSLPQDQRVVLSVFDLMGREVATLVNGSMKAGTHQGSFDAGNLPSGKYFYRLSAGSFHQIRFMTLLK